MEIKPGQRKQTSLFIAVLLFFLLACDATLSVGYPTPTISPPTETATSTPPSLELTLTSIPYTENNIDPPATITAQIPQLLGSDDARVKKFNQATSNLVQSEIETFKTGLTGLPNPPATAISMFDARYNVVYQDGDLWSLKFDMNIYVDGAAHPGDISRALNYDFAHSQTINLEELFLADSNYLQVLSKYCSDQLAERDIGFEDLTLGAQPTLENYHNWNISPDGLMITFDRGQVAAYAAPAQIIIIPYHELASLTDPQGPLAGFLR